MLTSSAVYDPRPPVANPSLGADFGASLPTSFAADPFLESLKQAPTTADPHDDTPPAPGLDLRRELCDQNLFIFHLPSDWRELEVKEAFSPFGPILSAKVVKRPDGSSKGYGFVCFERRESAVAAVEAMNGFCVGGKRLKVSLKKTPEECLNLQVQKLLRMSEHQDHFDRERDCSLFVFHLPPHWDDKDLRDKFLPFGPVVAAKVSRKDDGTSRGYGFVTCTDPRSAAMAILHLNGLEVCNKRLKVQPKQVGNGPHPRPDCTVFVFHLPNDWTDSVLRQFFSHCGRVISATVQRDIRGRSRGFGFVTFESPQCAHDSVIEMNGVKVGIKRLKVSLKRTAAERDSSTPNRQSEEEEDWSPPSPQPVDDEAFENSTNWAPPPERGAPQLFPWKQMDFHPSPSPSSSGFNVLLGGRTTTQGGSLIGTPLPMQTAAAGAFPVGRAGPLWAAPPALTPTALPAIPFAATHPNLTTSSAPIGNGTPYSQTFYAARGGPVLGRRPLRT